MTLPASLDQLKNLRFLDLRDNQLTSLPEELSRINSLERLDLRLNKQLILPEWLNGLAKRGCTVFI